MRRARWLWAPLMAVLAAGVLPVAVFVVASMLAGYHLGEVETGSMEPTYPVDSLLVVEPVDPSEVRVGMALSFVSQAEDVTVTHRVIDVVDGPRGPMFRTQGDANDAPDAALVPAGAVRGQVRWAVPKLGNALHWLVWPRGFLLLVVVPALLLAAAEVLELARRRRRGGGRWEDLDERYAVL